jgi:hypothetical protein
MPKWGNYYTQLGVSGLTMNIVQLLITSVVIGGVCVIVLLAVIPSLLNYPQGRDKDESDSPTPTPVKSDDRRGEDSIDLAA